MTMKQFYLHTRQLKILSTILFFCISCSSLNQMALSSKRNSIDLLSMRVIMNMPNPIHSNKENYEEGVVYIYTFNDGGGIILYEGALMQFEIDSYKPSVVVNKKEHTIYIGKENDRCWRKDVCKGLRFYYYNVPRNHKKQYDRIFNTMKILKRK